MARKPVFKSVPSHTIAKTISVEGVMVEVTEAMDLMEAGTGYRRMREPV